MDGVKLSIFKRCRGIQRIWSFHTKLSFFRTFFVSTFFWDNDIDTTSLEYLSSHRFLNTIKLNGRNLRETTKFPVFPFWQCSFRLLSLRIPFTYHPFRLYSSRSTSVYPYNFWILLFSVVWKDILNERTTMTVNYKPRPRLPLTQ